MKKIKTPDHEITNLLMAGKILAIKSFKEDEQATYILFDDGETYLELNEQDYYSYHDCSSGARELIVWKDKEAWKLHSCLPDAIRLT
jgi:hypothetical protein